MKWRIALTWIINLFLVWPVMLLGLIVFLPAYLQRKSGVDGGGYPITHFPKWAWLWDNEDHGIDGQRFWARRTEGWAYWRRCFVWSILRNPAFNLALKVLSVEMDFQYKIDGDPDIGDKDHPGKYTILAYSGAFWEYYSIGLPYSFAKEAKWATFWPWLHGQLTMLRCVRQRYGWKIEGRKQGEMCNFVCVFNPIMPYRGIVQ